MKAMRRGKAVTPTDWLLNLLRKHYRAFHKTFFGSSSPCKCPPRRRHRSGDHLTTCTSSPVWSTSCLAEVRDWPSIIGRLLVTGSIFVALSLHNPRLTNLLYPISASGASCQITQCPSNDGTRNIVQCICFALHCVSRGYAHTQPIREQVNCDRNASLMMSRSKSETRRHRLSPNPFPRFLEARKPLS